MACLVQVTNWFVNTRSRLWRHVKKQSASGAPSTTTASPGGDRGVFASLAGSASAGSSKDEMLNLRCSLPVSVRGGGQKKAGQVQLV